MQLITAGTLLLAVLVGLIKAAGAEGRRTVKSLEINIIPDTGLYFITPNDVLQAMGPDGRAWQGKPVASLHLEKLETRLQEHPFVAACDVHADLSGNVRIKVEQKRVLMRIINQGGSSYYLAANGQKLPYSEQFSPNVPVANGNIAESYSDSSYAKTKTLQDLLRIALFLEKNPIWAAQIEQVYVDNFSEFLLIPRVGNHSIVLGTCEELEEKMEKLRLFYAKALPSIGWDTYSKINLSYRGQVVATRRNTSGSDAELNAAHNNEQNTGH
ncbi:MAG: hypothetical protein KJS92_01560 [Bacteroidetes bacterium]|nr:hypothetical protein [Bacteroidota bacterium]